MRIKAFIICLSVLLLFACGKSDKTANAAFCDISGQRWAYGDTIRFDLPPDSVCESGRLAIAIRHSASYPYANLWLEVTGPANDSVYVDTINIVLADKYGKRLGRGMGVSFLKIDTLPRAYFLADSTRILVRHIMRVDTLTDIEQLGILPL